MGSFILIFGDELTPDEVITGRADSFGKAEKEASYWIERRIEKSGRECSRGYYSEAEIDVAKIIESHQIKTEKRYKKEREEQEKRDYQRLKLKYE